MSDRETALQVSELMYGSDADVVRRAELFYHFLTGTDAATLGLSFIGLVDTGTNQVTGPVPMSAGRIQVTVGQSFAFSAIATDTGGVTVSSFTGAVDDPDLADISNSWNGQPQNFLVTLTGDGASVVTVADDNFSVSFSMDVAAA